MGAPKSLRDLTETSDVKSKVLAHCYRLMVVELNVKVPLIEPSKYIAKIANRAGISERTKRTATVQCNTLLKVKYLSERIP